MNIIKRMITDESSTAGRIFNITIQLLIVLSLLGFSLQTLPDLTVRQRLLLRASETVIVLIFTAEYLLRIAYAPDRRKFIFSFFGIVDLLAILPFYLMLGIDLRAIRTLQLLRVVRILKLARYSKAMQRLSRAFKIAKEELQLFLFTTLVLLYLAAVGIYYFENPAQPEAFSSIFDALWWSVITLTTVGYGDIYPITAGGRFFTFMMLIIGLGIVSLPAGLIASALSEARKMED
ncbi:ion transporter [Ferrimonas senticii]|uniref:ion transporter n=1 Tax=Ferrimonas senticii TaxID=394566 RepID=UPI00040B71BA|nr:ion transporter [Ferrimonas senticii]